MRRSPVYRAVMLLRRAVRLHGVTTWHLERSHSAGVEWACLALKPGDRAVWHYHTSPEVAARRAIAGAIRGAT